MNVKELTGLRSGRLTVVRYLGNSVWECRCDCGNLRNTTSVRLKHQTATSCGCVHGRTTHGQSQTPTYESWAHMRNRCTSPKSRQWKWYGALGIKVCERWEVYENFVEDMGLRPEGTKLDRKNPHKNYTPDNCQWGISNTGRRRSTPMVGTQTLGEYAKQHGLKYHTAYARMRKGTL